MGREMAPRPPANRPDTLALIGPEYDQPSSQPADRTLIICSAPRTGSYELCRYLLAAGIGVPHEYFNSNYARRLGERWGFSKSPLEPSELSRYIKVLRRRRTQGGVFATKLQFQQFNRNLRNDHGCRLFEGAIVVHLFRPDAAAQYASLRSALETGVWDFSTRPTQSAVVRDSKDFDSFLKQALQELDALMGQDAGFRCIFTLLGIRPLFVTTDELFSNSREVVCKIAGTMGVTVNDGELERAIALSAPYGRETAKATAELAEHFRRVVFPQA
jgi:trehalose 2-sulfotransferase